MAKNPLDKRRGLFKRRGAGEKQEPTPVAKAIGTVFLMLAILLIGSGAIIGFVQGVKKEPAGEATTTTASVTTAAATTETTTAEATTVTVAETKATQVL